jgi:hypothetical protein
MRGGREAGSGTGGSGTDKGEAAGLHVTTSLHCVLPVCIDDFHQASV